MDFSQYGGVSEEWRAFREANPDVITPRMNQTEMSPLKQQEAYNTMRGKTAKAAVKESGLDKVIVHTDYEVMMRDNQKIPVRAYRPKNTVGKMLPAFVYFHGGGFIGGSLDTEDLTCSRMAHEMSMAIIHVCYRHTPQISGLVPWYDAIDGFEWIMSNTTDLAIDPSRVVVGGASAGSSLSAAVVTNEMKRSRESGSPPRIKGQLLAIATLIQPAVFPFHLFADKSKTSLVQCQYADQLNKEAADRMTALLGGNPEDELWNPGLVDEKDLKGFPRTAFLVSGNDMLRDDNLLYATKLRNANVPTKVHIFPGLTHGFALFDDIPSTKRFWPLMYDCIRWASIDDGEWFVEVPPQPIPKS